MKRRNFLLTSLAASLGAATVAKADIPPPSVVTKTREQLGAEQQAYLQQCVELTDTLTGDKREIADVLLVSMQTTALENAALVYTQRAIDYIAENNLTGADADEVYHLGTRSWSALTNMEHFRADMPPVMTAFQNEVFHALAGYAGIAITNMDNVIGPQDLRTLTLNVDLYQFMVSVFQRLQANNI
jgi:hypothetical protein